MFDDIKLYNH